MDFASWQGARNENISEYVSDEQRSQGAKDTKLAEACTFQTPSKINEVIFMSPLKMERGRDNVILRAISIQIKKIDRKLLKFIEDMKETMFHENGIGLAAPQVGKNIRVVICKFNHETPHQLIVPMINPQITHRSKAMGLHEEGCLSLPKEFSAIARHDALTVKYLDIKGKENILRLSGLNARIVQHEVDHIDGKLYVDHLKDEATLKLKAGTNRDPSMP